MSQKRWYVQSEWLYVGLACLTALLVFPMLSASKAVWGAWWVLLFAAVYMVGPLVRSGRASKADRAEQKVSREESIRWHRRAGAILLGLTLVGFIGIETAIRKIGGLWGDPRLLTVHLVLAACAAIAFVTVRFFYTGTRTPQYHRKLVYVFMTFYGAVFATGSILIAEKFLF